MSNGPFFSILVPTYNQAHYLAPALDSLLAQTEADWEAVVVDDGSTDATPAVLDEYARRDVRIRPFRKANGGTASALNAALRQARGQWICWLSSDDLFDPRKLEINRDWIKRDPDCRFFFSYFRLLREATGELTDHDLWGPLPEHGCQIVTLFYRNYISGITICIHRESWLAVGEFDESLRYAQDYDMWLRLLARYPARFIPEWTCINRNHPGQGSEVFMQACFYDTAKAGIRFLNAHPFQECFPALNWAEPAQVRRAVEKTLEYATEPTALLYSLGPHPALLMRLVEWVWTYAGPDAAELRLRIRQRLSEAARQHASTPLGFLERIIAAACQGDQPVAYAPTRPDRLGALSYWAHQSDPAAAQPLLTYLRQFEGLYPPDWPGPTSTREIVLVLPPGIPLELVAPSGPLRRVLEIAHSLQHAGCQVALVGRANQRLGIIEEVIYLGVTDERAVQATLAALAPLDTLITIDYPRLTGWPPSERQLALSLPGGEAPSGREIAAELLRRMEALPVRAQADASAEPVWKSWVRRARASIPRPLKRLARRLLNRLAPDLVK